MSNDERTVCSLRTIHFCRASVSDADVSQNGVAGTRATSTGSSLDRVSWRERVKRETIPRNARDRFVWATRDLRFSCLTGVARCFSRSSCRRSTLSTAGAIFETLAHHFFVFVYPRPAAIACGVKEVLCQHLSEQTAARCHIRSARPRS